MREHAEIKVGGISRKSLAWWRLIPWIIAACCLISLLWLRFGADLGDFGFRNVLSYLIALAVWLSTQVAMMLTTRRSIWVTAMLLPVGLCGVFFLFYRIERVDSEIVPVFVSRWSEAVALPETQDASTSEAEAFFAPRNTDYPMFLGPHANATVGGIVLETNWTEHPPQVAWNQPIGKGWSGFAIQGDAAYTMEQRDQAEWVTCYDASTGKLLWYYPIPGLHFNPMGGAGPRATPTIYRGRVYAQSAVSQLVCLDMRSGKCIWSADLLELTNATQAGLESAVAWGRSASPIVVDDKVIVPLGGASKSKFSTLIAMDAETGAEVWRAGDDQISYSTPVIVTLLGQPQIVYISELKLTSYAIADGSELWSVDWPSHSNGDASVSQPIVIDESRVLLSKGYGSGSQVLGLSKNESTWTPKSIWKVDNVLRTKFTSCVVKEEHAFGLSDGILECVDLQNGKRAWKKGRYRHGQVLLVGDTLVVTAENGSVVLVAADSTEFRELASLPVIGDVTWNTPALSGNRLLIRNSDQAACVILPLKGSSTAADNPSTVTAQESTSE